MSHDFDETLRILSEAVHSLDPREFAALEEDAVATLARGNKLVFSGLGKNVPICEKVVGTLNSVGLASAFIHTNSALHGDLGIVRDGDLVIILTKSGETSESVLLSRLLGKRDCTRWLLTFSRDSTLYREIANHVAIELEHEGDSWNILPNNSTVLNLIILQGLAMSLIEHFEVPVEVLHANHPGGAIGEKLVAAERGDRIAVLTRLPHRIAVAQTASMIPAYIAANVVREGTLTTAAESLATYRIATTMADAFINLCARECQ